MLSTISSPFTKLLVVVALSCVFACEPPALQQARQAVARQDFTTALALYEKLCAEHPKEQLWHVEFDAAVAQLKAQVMDDKRNDPHETFTHNEVELLVAELLRRHELEAATDVLFERARLNRTNQHWVDAATYLLRAADIVPHSDRRELYERQALQVLTDKASVKDALSVAAARVAAFPKSVRWCDFNASLLAKQDNYDAAIAEYTRCQELDPENFDNQLKFGAQLAALEEYKKRAEKRK